MDLSTQGTILYISSADLSLPNGPGVNEREFCISLLAALGARALPLVPRPRRRLDEFLYERCTFYATNRSPASARRLLGQFDAARKARAILSRHAVDLIVARIGLVPFGMKLILRGRAVPLVLKTVGDVGFLRRYSGVKGLFGRVLAPIHERATHSLIRRAIGVDACTPALLDALRPYCGADHEILRLIPNATNTERFNPMPETSARQQLGLDRFEPILGFVGGRPAQRGGRELLSLATRLLADHPRLGVVIVGANVGSLSEEASSLGLTEHCVFPGQIPYEQVPLYINAFTVGFALDKADRVSVVGNSNQKVRQYVACGVPAIASAGGSEFLVDANLGSVVDVTDLGEIERETRRWLSHSAAEREQFRGDAVAFARRRLSTDQSMKERLHFWSTRLAQVGLRNDAG